MYPDEAPQGPTYPLAVYREAFGGWTRAMGTDPGLVSGRVHVEIFAATYHEAQRLAVLTANVLQRYKGVVDGLVIEAIFLDNETDRGWGEERVYSVLQDYMIWYQD
jgi:hypothetical protein